MSDTSGVGAVVESARALIAALDRKRKVKPWMFIGAVGPKAIHYDDCPAPKRGRTTHGPCNCGADAQQAELDDALQALRKAVRR